MLVFLRSYSNNRQDFDWHSASRGPSAVAMFLLYHKIMINLVNMLTMFVVIAATGALIKTPQNAFGLQEDPIVLECASNSSDIIWSYNATNISGPGCTATDPGLRRPWIETPPETTAL